MTKQNTLRVTEIFYSLQGEANTVGLPTVFVRLTGCPLRCQYCDTAYAFHGGKSWILDEIVDKVKTYGARYVTVTGGEPLAQPACLMLLKRLCDEGYHVSLETSGALPVAEVDPRVVKVLDLKTPGSEEASKNLWSNLDALQPHDQIKFVICHREDYDWVKDKIAEHGLDRLYHVLLSPSHQQMDAKTLADWILEDRLNVRFQIQLHKMIWGDVPGV